MEHLTTFLEKSSQVNSIWISLSVSFTCLYTAFKSDEREANAHRQFMLSTSDWQSVAYIMRKYRCLKKELWYLEFFMIYSYLYILIVIFLTSNYKLCRTVPDCIS